MLPSHFYDAQAFVRKDLEENPDNSRPEYAKPKIEDLGSKSRGESPSRRPSRSASPSTKKDRGKFSLH